jgi:hypothetical protein
MGTQKAWVSGIISGTIAFLTSMLTAFQGQTTGLDTITMSQWITAVLAFIVAFGGTGGLTYKIPNAAPADQDQKVLSRISDEHVA